MSDELKSMKSNQILMIEIIDNKDGTVNGQFTYNHFYFKNLKTTKEILTKILNNISEEMIKHKILDKPIIH